MTRRFNLLFTVLGVVAVGSVLYFASQQSAATSPRHPQTKTTDVGDEKTVAEYDANGKLHGMKTVWVKGDLFAETEYNHDQWVWIKLYWPNGEVKSHLYENADYDIVVDEYDDNGRLVGSRIR